MHSGKLQTICIWNHIYIHSGVVTLQQHNLNILFFVLALFKNAQVVACPISSFHHIYKSPSENKNFSLNSYLDNSADRELCSAM